MPLEALIALVVGGIAGIAILSHFFGFSASLRFDDDAAARTAFLRVYPDIRVHDATLSRDGRAALIETAEGPGIVWAMGADSCARLLRDARAEEVSGGLLIHLGDVTAPRIRLNLTEDERPRWRQLTGAQP